VGELRALVLQRLRLADDVGHVLLTANHIALNDSQDFIHDLGVREGIRSFK
jgi:hypothetical protein